MVKNYTTKNRYVQLLIAYYFGDRIEIINIKKHYINDNNDTILEITYKVTEDNFLKLQRILERKAEPLGVGHKLEIAKERRREQITLYYDSYYKKKKGGADNE